MRWFKHLSHAHDDQALAAIVEEFGAEGYGIYWLLLEHFAAVMEKDCTEVPRLSHSVIRWADICHCSTRRFRGFVQRAAELMLIECQTPTELRQNSVNTPSILRQFSSKTISERFEIGIPKLLKYRDEYSRKSGVTPDKNPDKLPARSDTDTDTDKNPPIVPPQNPVGGVDESLPLPPKTTALDREFAEDWPQFWVRVGHRPALEAYKKARKKIPRQDLLAAIARAGPVILQNAKTQGITPLHPATWLNQERWLDEPADVPLAVARGQPRNGVSVTIRHYQRELEQLRREEEQLDSHSKAQ